MAADVGIKIQLEGEREYKKSLKEIISQQKEWDSEIKAVESALDDETSAQEKARKKADLLTKSIDSQQKKIGLMKDQLEKVEEVYGKDSEQAKKLRTQINNATTALNKMKAQASGLTDKMKHFGESMKSAGEKMQKAGDTMTKAITGPLTAAAVASVAAWNDVDSALDEVTKMTGATGTALEELKGVATDIATTIPTDFETAAKAVGEVNTKFGLTGDALESLSTQFVKFSAITGQDVTAAVDGVSKAMAAFNMDASDAPGLMDAIAKASQKTGISVDTLESSLVKNAAALAGLGLGAEEAVAFLAQLEMSGADTNTVMSGLQKALTVATKNGQTLPEALADFQSKMNGSASETEKLQAACDLFGKKAGPAIYEACNQGTLSFDDLAGAAEDATGTIDQTFKDLNNGGMGEFTIAANKVKLAGAELGGEILDTVAPAVSALGDAAQTAGEWFKGLDDSQKQLVLKAGAFAIGIGPIVSGLGKITTAAGDVVIKLADIGLTAGEIIAAGGPVSLAIAALVGLGAAMVVARDKALESDETLQRMITLCEDSTTALTEATTALNTAISDAQDSFDETNAQAETADQLIDRLAALQEQGNLTTTEFIEMKTIVGELNTMYPGLNAVIDDNTGSLNKGTDEMKRYVEQARKMALIEAYTKASEEVLLDLVKAQTELTRARNAESEALSILQEKQDALDKAWENAPTNWKGQKEADAAVIAASNALKEAETEYIKYKDAVDAAQASVDAANETLGLYTQAQEELNASLSDGSDAADDFVSSVDGAVKRGARTIPKSTDKIQMSFTNAVRGIVQQQPKAKTASGAFGTIIATTVNSKVQSVKSAALLLGKAAGTAVTEINTVQKPAVQKAGGQFGDALTNSISSKKASVIAASEALASGAAQAVANKKSEFTAAGKAAGDAIKDGITSKKDAIASATTSASNAVTSVKGTYKTAGETLGSATGDGVISGFNAKKAGISNSIAGGASRARDENYGSYKKAGEALGDAIATGINNKSGYVNQIAASLARGAADTINKELKINSPSKIVIPSGEAIAEGLEVGMERRLGYVQRAAAGLSRAAVPEVATGAGIAASRSTGSDAIYNAVYAAVRAAAPSVVINEKSFKRALVTMGVSVA